MTEVRPHLLITCEHGGNRIPPRYRDYFVGYAATLRSHRGYDAGALTLARELASACQAPLIAAATSRLLVDLNRTLGHPRLHGEAIRAATPELRREIVARYYQPYRQRAEGAIAAALARGRQVVHLSCHSFTPVLDGEVRRADIGLLYDPARAGEKALCAAWRTALRQNLPDLRVRLNYPYAGTSDGFTAYLRRRFGPDEYVGIEIEINQRHVGRTATWRRLRGGLIESLREVLAARWPAAGSERAHEVAQPLQEHLDRQDAEDETHQATERRHDAIAEHFDQAGGGNQDQRAQGDRQS
jgi:predicted N-formylglutamate amidohydrolase